MRLALAEPWYGAEEREMVTEVLASRWLTTGPQTVAFEEEWAAATGTQYAVATSSGTAALLLALSALKVRYPLRRYVVVPAFTCAPTVAAVLLAGLRPIFVEAESERLGMDPEALETALRAWQGNVVAVVPVHVYGTPVSIEVFGIAMRYDVDVLEDCAEAHGAQWTGAFRVGSLGTLGAFSFRGEKMLTTMGAGGAVTTNDESLADEMRRSREQFLGHGANRYEDTLRAGWGFELPNVNAAFGRAQIPRLGERVARHRQQQAEYRRLLRDGPVETLPEVNGSVWWRFCVLIDQHPRRVIERMALQGFEAVRAFRPLCDQPIGVDAPVVGSFAVDRRVNGRGLCLPIGMHVTDRDVREVVEMLYDALDARR